MKIGPGSVFSSPLPLPLPLSLPLPLPVLLLLPLPLALPICLPLPLALPIPLPLPLPLSLPLPLPVPLLLPLPLALPLPLPLPLLLPGPALPSQIDSRAGKRLTHEWRRGVAALSCQLACRSQSVRAASGGGSTKEGALRVVISKKHAMHTQHSHLSCNGVFLPLNSFPRNIPPAAASPARECLPPDGGWRPHTQVVQHRCSSPPVWLQLSACSWIVPHPLIPCQEGEDLPGESRKQW